MEGKTDIDDSTQARRDKHSTGRRHLDKGVAACLSKP